MPMFDLDTTGLSPPSNTHISTRDLLVDIGFEPVIATFTDLQPGYCYNFGNFVLHASQVTGKYLRPEIFFTGTIVTPRSISAVEFSLLLNVDSYELGLALIAHGIGRSFIPLLPTPWLDQGRKWEDHLPGRREARLHQERPQCHVEADWFRVAVKKLVEHGVHADDTQVFKVSFLSGVLKIQLSSQSLVMPATGDDWPEEYICLSRGLVHLSKRTPSEGVWFGVWKDEMAIGRLHLKIKPPLCSVLNSSVGQITKVAWRPKGSVEIGLVAVRIRPGDITEVMWLQALSDRVSEMALAESDPIAAVRAAAWKMDCLAPRSPEDAGQFLVKGNWALHEHFKNQMNSSDGAAFPEKVEFGDESAQEAMQDTDLAMWVDMAIALCSTSGRD